MSKNTNFAIISGKVVELASQPYDKGPIVFGVEVMGDPRDDGKPPASELIRPKCWFQDQITAAEALTIGQFVVVSGRLNGRISTNKKTNKDYYNFDFNASRITFGPAMEQVSDDTELVPF